MHIRSSMLRLMLHFIQMSENGAPLVRDCGKAVGWVYHKGCLGEISAGNRILTIQPLAIPASSVLISFKIS
jgi:hypothetical protein